MEKMKMCTIISLIFLQEVGFSTFLFMTFHSFIVIYYFKKFKNFKILKFMIPIFIVSFFDTSMESVRFPFLYYSFIGYFFNEDSIYLQ